MAHTIVVLFPQLFVICLTRCIISCVKKGLSPQGPPQCHCQLAGKKSQMPNKHLAMNEAFEFDFCPTCCERCDLHVCSYSVSPSSFFVFFLISLSSLFKLSSSLNVSKPTAARYQVQPKVSCWVWGPNRIISHEMTPRIAVVAFLKILLSESVHLHLTHRRKPSG